MSKKKGNRNFLSQFGDAISYILMMVFCIIAFSAVIGSDFCFFIRFFIFIAFVPFWPILLACIQNNDVEDKENDKK